MSCNFSYRYFVATVKYIFFGIMCLRKQLLLLLFLLTIFQKSVTGKQTDSLTNPYGKAAPRVKNQNHFQRYGHQEQWECTIHVMMKFCCFSDKRLKICQSILASLGIFFIHVDQKSTGNLAMEFKMNQQKKYVSWVTFTTLVSHNCQ